jgi:cytochrome c-type biogenesis protein CcmE
MTRKQKRGTLILGSVVLLSVAAIFVMFALRDNVNYSHSPSDVSEGKVKPGQRFRLGGLVLDASVKRGVGTKVDFVVTDTLKSVAVTFDGILPDLFREGQSVVTEGRLDGNLRFQADTVLAKHDETYMPPDVAKSLKERGITVDAKAKHPGASSNSNSSPLAQPTKGRSP